MSTAATPVVRSNAQALPALPDFESATLDPEIFDHEAHVYVAWELLGQDSFLDASVRFTSALRKLTRTLGIEDKYHETISWFFMALIAERRAAMADAGWERFKAANPDLFSNAKGLLGRYYSEERLFSKLAREQFILPDMPRTAPPNPSVSGPASG